MYDKPLIGLLCNTLSDEAFHNINLELPITVMQFTPNGIDWTGRKVNGWVLKNNKWEKSVSDFPVAVYNQRYTSSSKISRRLEAIIGKGKVFNICTMFDKYTIYKIFNSSPLADFMIPTWPYDHILLFYKLSEGNPVLIKPAKGSFGNGIIKFEKTGNVYEAYPQMVHPTEKWGTTKQLFRYINRIMSPNYNYIMQPFLNFMTNDGNVFDMRYMVQKSGNGGWEVSADFCRISCDEFFITNMACEILPIEEMMKKIDMDDCLLSQMKDISIEAAKLVENKLGPMGELCVDFGIEDNGRLRIIEINGKPDKSLFEFSNNGNYEKVILMPLRYAEYLANNE